MDSQTKSSEGRSPDWLNQELIDQLKGMIESLRTEEKILVSMIRKNWKDKELILRLHDTLQSTRDLIGNYENEIKDRSSR